MGEDALGQLQAGGPQESRPVDGVEADDFLADEVQVGGPEAFAIHRAHVRGERVEPHVEHVRRFAGDGNAPLDIGAGDGKIVEALAQEGDDFVAARFGLEKFGVRFVKFQQAAGEGRKLEEEVLFGDGLGGPAAIGAGIAGLGVIDVEIVEDAVLAGVRAFIDVAVIAATLEQVIDHARVFGAGGALEVIDLEAERLPLVFELAGDDVAEFLGRFAGALGGALHIDAVLVGAGGEHGFVSLHALEAPDHVGHDGGVGMADVGRGIDVVDGSSEVVFHLVWFRYAKLASAMMCLRATPLASASLRQSSYSGA